MSLEGKILQSAKLYLLKESEEKARHIKHWEDYLKICKEMEIRPDYYGRTFVEEFPIGKPIYEWPEKEPIYDIGPERIMYCVGPDDDFSKIRELGVTIIQSYQLPWINTLYYLDKAKDNGLRVMYSIADRIHNEILRKGYWDRDEVGDIITKCKDHPAMWGWHTFDESNLYNRNVSWDEQQNVYIFFKIRDPEHLVIQSLAGGTGEWDVINFNSLDAMIPSTYPYDGTGECWGKKPLEYLEIVAKEEREYLDYLDEHSINKPVLFIFQCCDEPARVADSKVPLGHIEDQFNVLNDYGLFSGGLALWAWNHNYFGPSTSDEMYQEIKNLFDKIKEN